MLVDRPGLGRSWQALTACCLPMQALALSAEGCLHPQHAADPGMHSACFVLVLALIDEECRHKQHAVACSGPGTGS